MEFRRWLFRADLGCRSSRRACLSHGAEPAPCPHLEWPMTDILLVPGTVPLADWRAIHRGAAVRVDPASAPHIAESAAAVGRILAHGDPVYGINTGFGKLARVRIDAADLATLQRNIALSHAAGTGDPSPEAVVRLKIGRAHV